MPLAPGSHLGRYEVVAPLGAGGMGEVYRARDPRLEREVAVKILPAAPSLRPDRLRRFEEEARAGGALNHPNVLAVLDVGSEQGSPYVVFELLEGETLDERLQEGPLVPRKAIEYAVQACHGLAAAHARGIVHRDLKPSNLFLTSDGRLKILDFGLAKLTGADAVQIGADTAARTATAPGFLIGTLAYMSPEQAKGEAADARSDIFALGATLYEMLSGRPAFLRPSPAETLSAILNHDPEPIASSNEGPLPAALEPIVRRCLEKNPAERFQSAEDLAFALGALTVSRPWGTVLSRGGGRRWLAAGIAAAALAAGLTAGYRLRPRATVPAGPLAVVPFTSFPGQEIAPSFSPDGSQLAFGWSPEGKGDQFDLYVKVIGGEKPLRLTDRPSEGLWPAWSPDGRQIAFSRWGKEGSGLYLVSALGGAERKLLDHAVSYFLAGALSWSPDGKQLAFSDRSLFLVDVATLQRREVHRPSGECSLAWLPAFSPDGLSLAFSCLVSGGVSPLFVMPLDGGGARQVAVVSGDLRGLLWADTNHLLVAVNGDLLRVSTRGGEAQKILSGLDVVMPALSRDGRRLAFTQQQTMITSIWRVPLAGPAEAGGPPERLLSSSRRQRSPAFSPDGRRLAFDSNRTGFWEIWISNADGSDPRPLTSFRGPVVGGARWSPDGRELVFEGHVSGRAVLYVAPLEGAPPRQIATGFEDSYWPTWSRDGRSIYFYARAGEADQLFRIPREGGPAVRLTRRGGVFPRESPDGRAILYLRDWQEGRILSAPIEGGDGEPVPGMPVRPQEWQGDWTVTPSGIYFVEGEAPRPRVGFLEFATRRVHPVLAVPGQPESWGGLAVSPDGRTLLYSQRDGNTSDIMLVDDFR